MPKTLTMIDPRPNSSGGHYERGQTYTLPDDIADYFLSIGVARYPTLQQFDVVAGRDPSTGTVRKIGTARDPLGTPVVAVTSPGGGIEFPGLSPLTSAVRNAVQYIVSHADIEARPPRLWPVDAVPYRIMAGWNGAAWGNDSDSRRIIRVDSATRTASTGYEWPAGTTIAGMFAASQSLLVMTKTDDRYSLWRTEDGVSVTHVHDLGRDPDGVTHWQHVMLLFPGLTRGQIHGQPALMLATYNIMDSYGGVAGTQGDAIYLAYSIDDGRTWQRLNTWTWNYATGAGERKIRHFHAVRYDKWRDCWWIAAGDTNDQSCIIRWDGKTAGPGNVSPAEMQAGSVPGWQCRTGSQRWRSVDLIITEDWIESFTDTKSVHEGGIWRMRPDFSASHRINHATNGKEKDGWFGLLTSDGTHLWCDNVKGPETAAGDCWIGIYASRNGNRYYEIGRMHVLDGVKAIPLSFFELDGRVWLCATNPAGKTTFETTVMELRGLFREERADNLAPAYFVDFANGSDANTGRSKAQAWKTAAYGLAGSRMTHGARLMLSSGTSTENGVASIIYNANALPAGDTSRHIQISGQGRDSTTLILSGATEGWRGAAATKWDVELTDFTIRQSDTTKNILWDNSTAQAGSGFTLRDMRVGDRSVGSSNALYARAASHKAIRSAILNISGSLKFGAKAETGGNVSLDACLVAGGFARVANGSKLIARHCEFREAKNTPSIQIASTATVAPLIANCVFDDTGTNPGVLNDSASVTLDATNCYGNVFQQAVAGNVPAPILPVAGILDRDVDTLKPFEWSAIAGVAQPAGVEWDYYGNPFRARPAIGAVEIPPTF